MNDIDYNKKIKRCEILCAKKFQKFVFKIERLKWKIVRKLIPNYLKIVDKFIEKNCEKKIRKAKKSEEIDAIKRNGVMQKMALRKEYNKKENLNYHINKNRPSQFIQELNWNKSIHQRNLKWNGILLPASIIASSLGFWQAIPFSIYQAISTFINFQCINVQNYNIFRIKKIENRLKVKEQKIEQNQIEKYKDGYELIGNKIEEKKDIVNINEIVENISSIKQLKQIKELLIEEQKKRDRNNKIRRCRRK